MASIEERVRKLVDDNIEVEGRPLGRPLDLDVNIAEAGVASADIVALWQMVNAEFNVSIPAEEFAEMLTPQALIDYLNANTG
ncbi:MAG: acyl carrier protein [Chloroflexota bacterium]|nr:acyl carrier protein [Chloroflexota bacterium]MDE2639728.1 acyl carrier protein [Chloroflexota bacterium]